MREVSTRIFLFFCLFGLFEGISSGFQLVHPFSFHPGLPSATDSKFVKQLRELQESKRIDRIPLIPSTPEEMADMLKLCSYVRFKVPQQVRR